MDLYETTIIMRQDVSPTQVEALTNELVDLLKGKKAIVAKTEYCGLRPLTYPIKKNRKGHYVLMNIDATAEAMAEYERQMGLNENVLRFLSVRVEEHEDGPSALYSQSRSFRDNIGWEVSLPKGLEHAPNTTEPAREKSFEKPAEKQTEKPAEKH